MVSLQLRARLLHFLFVCRTSPGFLLRLLLLASLIGIAPGPARAAVGDIGVWCDAAGGQTATNTAWTKFQFNTADRNDGIYTKDAGHDDFDFSEAGNYLVLYLIRATGSNRSIVPHACDEERRRGRGWSLMGLHPAG